MTEGFRINGLGAMSLTFDLKTVSGGSEDEVPVPCPVAAATGFTPVAPLSPCLFFFPCLDLAPETALADFSENTTSLRPQRGPSHVRPSRTVSKPP